MQQENFRFSNVISDRMDHITEESINCASTKRNNDPHMRNNSNMKNNMTREEELNLIDNFEGNSEQIFDQMCNSENQRTTDENIQYGEKRIDNDVEDEIENQREIRELEENCNCDANAFIKNSQIRDDIESYIALQSTYGKTNEELGVGPNSPVEIVSDPRDIGKFSDINIKHVNYKIENDNIEEESSQESQNNEDQNE